LQWVTIAAKIVNTAAKKLVKNKNSYQHQFASFQMESLMGVEEFNTLMAI